jgi:hypothetical protein
MPPLTMHLSRRIFDQRPLVPKKKKERKQEESEKDCEKEDEEKIRKRRNKQPRIPQLRA